MSNIQYSTCLASSINGCQTVKMNGGLELLQIFHSITPRASGKIELRSWIAPVAVSDSEQESGKRRSPWPFARKSSTPRQPAFASRMKASFVLLGRIRLSEKHPGYEERKAYLQKKGFHLDPGRKAWVPDPNRVPDPA